MSDNDFVSSLSEEEAQTLAAEIAQAKQNVLQRRQEKQSAELLVNYRRDMLAARGKPHILRQIKASYAARGVRVDEVVFS